MYHHPPIGTRCLVIVPDAENSRVFVEACEVVGHRFTILATGEVHRVLVRYAGATDECETDPAKLIEWRSYGALALEDGVYRAFEGMGVARPVEPVLPAVSAPAALTLDHVRAEIDIEGLRKHDGGETF